MRRPRQKVTALAHHRNGGGKGEGFSVAILDDKDHGRMVVIRPDRGGPGDWFALNVELLAAGVIDFGKNSWDGLHFAPVVSAAIEAEERR